MHLCFVSHTGEASEGGERSLLEIIRYVRENTTHRITVASPSGPLQRELARIPGVERVTMPFLSLRRSRNPLTLARFAASFLAGVVRLRRWLSRETPHIVHANSATAALYAAVALRRSGPPLIWHMRDIQPHEGVFSIVLPYTGRRSARVVAISRAVAENLSGFGVAEEKLRIIHNAVLHPGRGDREGFRAGLGVSSGEPLLGVVGKLLGRKGQRTAIRALPAIRARFPAARLVLCGGGEGSAYARALREEVERLGLAGAVLFAGYQRNTADVYAGIDVLLVPSEREPFGRVVVEGMFAERPLVASRVDGIPEIVRDGRDGILVEPADAEALAAAVIRVLEDPTFASALAAEAARRARERFHWRVTGSALQELYEETVHPEPLES